jgi:NADP-dependent 3-hydroxy acid dehydrogenase YdfG
MFDWIVWFVKIQLLWAPWIAIVYLGVKFYQYYQAGMASPDVNPSGKWILVTGAGSGIGKATAEAILRYGGNVYAADLNEAALNQAFSQYKSDRVVTLKVDVTNESDVRAAAARCATTGLYGVVNSAGVKVV